MLTGILRNNFIEVLNSELFKTFFTFNLLQLTFIYELHFENIYFKVQWFQNTEIKNWNYSELYHFYIKCRSGLAGRTSSVSVRFSRNFARPPSESLLEAYELGASALGTFLASVFRQRPLPESPSVDDKAGKQTSARLNIGRRRDGLKQGSTDLYSLMIC